MKTDDIRSTFLNFFKSKAHAIIESDSVVPKDDPTVLFTTAGMQQFKRQFLGHIEDYTKACSSQKCIRTDDLEDVGKTDFHHTFFEMLGNFSFGDYFKREAISWAWEFLTQKLDIPAERLWVSVYHEDIEAENIWKNEIKIPEHKIFKLGDKSNFWPANAKQNGPNGPCGPCSEIFYDFAPESSSTPKDPDDEAGRFSEIWNLVFTQFNRIGENELTPLPSQNIDTGMGLERLAAVLQNKKSNFEIDIFTPILKAINQHLSIKQDETDKHGRIKRYILADHLRSITFAIADGVMPSNEGRGYVVKKLIIDICDIALQSGEEKPVIYQLIPAAIESMQTGYSYLTDKQGAIVDIVKNIEEGYIKVRRERLPEFTKQAAEAEHAEDLGKIIFTFRDTYGLAINTIEEALDNLIRSKKVHGDFATSAWDIFSQLMENQQNQSRLKSKMTGDVFTDDIKASDISKTQFLGYEHAESASNILKIFQGNDLVHKAQKGDEIKVILDATPFYAESGGQVGDSGFIEAQDSAAKVEITQTTKTDDIFIHHGRVVNGEIAVGNAVSTRINVDRRLSIMRNHTATHLLQSALRQVLGEHIQQQGSYVGADRLRFDFTHPKALSSEEITKIEDIVNIYIRACDAIEIENLPLEEARKSGALAFFAEKYGKTVRVVTIGPYSKEFCGGTHLGSTGQIGLFKILGESAIAQGVRRIEAKTGLSALEEIRDIENTMDELAKTLKSSRSDIKQRIHHQVKRLKLLEKEMEEIHFQSIKQQIDEIISKGQTIGKTTIISRYFDNCDMNILRKISDLLKQKLKSAAVCLGSAKDDSAAIIISVTDDLINQGCKANELIKDIAPLIDGSGGGRPQMAQAGSKAVNKIQIAIQKAEMILKERVEQ